MKFLSRYAVQPHVVYLLFLISRSGVPRHWTTSVNRGDTKGDPLACRLRVDMRLARTIIAHGDIRNNLLQDRLPLR